MPNANLVPVRNQVNAFIDVTPGLRCQVIDARKSRVQLVEWTDEVMRETKYFLWHQSRRQQASTLTKGGDLKRHYDRLSPISKQIAIKWCSRHQAKLPPLSTLVANEPAKHQTPIHAEQQADGVYDDRDIVCAGRHFKNVPESERKIFNFMVGKGRDTLAALYKAVWNEPYHIKHRHKIQERVSKLNQRIEQSGVSFSLPKHGDCIERNNDESVTPESRRNHQTA